MYTYTKLPYNIQNCQKIYQMAAKCTKWSLHMHQQGPPKCTQIGIFGIQICTPSGNPDENAFRLTKPTQSECNRNTERNWAKEFFKAPNAGKKSALVPENFFFAS
jgi:hypothetical protein